MRICIVTPARAGSKSGNRVTALRWARMLRDMGHRPMLQDAYEGERADVLVALHATKSAAAVAQFAASFPARPIVVVLTGTDVYADLPTSRAARRTLALATRIVVLQPRALDRLDRTERTKARVVLQSVPVPASRPPPRTKSFELCVVGHLRPVKDPLRAAMAARDLPASSRIAVLHAGAALSPVLEQRARREMEINARYRWLGELARHDARRLIGRCRALVVSSKVEGGSHVVAEALVAGTPVLATRIDGNVGQLGAGYAGYFSVGDTRALAALMLRLEGDTRFARELRRWCRRVASDFAPVREMRALTALFGEIGE